MSTETASARERILGVAGGLFFREGYRAVGVDRVIADAKVAKATFYRHFRSKDDLIVAWLMSSDAWMEAWLDGATRDSDRPVEALFKATEALAKEPGCLGCTFQGASSEFADASHPGRNFAIAHKRRVLDKLEAIAARERVARPRVLAEQLFLLLEGAWAAVRMFGAKAPLAHIVDAAQAMTAIARAERLRAS